MSESYTFVSFSFHQYNISLQTKPKRDNETEVWDSRTLPKTFKWPKGRYFVKSILGRWNSRSPRIHPSLGMFLKGCKCSFGLNGCGIKGYTKDLFARVLVSSFPIHIHSNGNEFVYQYDTYTYSPNYFSLYLFLPSLFSLFISTLIDIGSSVFDGTFPRGLDVDWSQG